MKKLLLLLIPVLLLGCSKNDDNESYIDNIQENIVGTWRWSEKEEMVDSEGNVFDFTRYEIYQFNIDGICEHTSNNYNPLTNEIKEFTIKQTYKVNQENKSIEFQGIPNDEGISSVLAVLTIMEMKKNSFTTPGYIYYRVK